MMRMIMRKPLIDDPITNVERVAVELRTLRRARNITQQTLADRAQVARRTLTHAESAQNVGIQEWCRIANALGYELTLRPQNTVVFEELPDVFNYGRIRDNAAVSLVMPVREESYASGDLMGVFAMNRPEGYLRYILEERLKRLGAPSDMFLLFLAGSHQIGRLTYTLPGEALPQSTGERLEELLSSPSGPLFERLVDQYALGSGISGVQPKTLVPLALRDANCEPAEHTAMPLNTVIVKAEGLDYPGLARNEFFCLSVAKEAGFDVPDFWLSDDGRLLIMARFDRTPEGAVLGFEDMAVLTGRTTRQKYEGSYEMIARAVDLFSGEARTVQLRKLFERVALSCWMRDGDAHLKNFGMLYEHPMAPRRLAPVYDVVCTDVYPDLDREM